jgi:hypothetical protein
MARAFVIVVAVLAVLTLPIFQTTLIVSLGTAFTLWVFYDVDRAPTARATAEAVQRSKTALGELEASRARTQGRWRGN